MAPFHDKSGRPKLGQPTPKATSCMASAEIASTHYRYTGHPSNGMVFVEESGYQDAATQQNVAMSVRTSLIDAQRVDLAVIKASLNHTDFGAGETGMITATLYRDSANSQNSRSQSIRLDGNRSTTVGIGRTGELVDFLIEYSGTASGAIGSVDMEIDGQGRSGSATRVTSVSATP